MMFFARSRRPARVVLACWLGAGLTLAMSACAGTQATSPQPSRSADQPESSAANIARRSAYLTTELYDARLTGVTYPFPVSFYKFNAQHQAMEMAYMDLRPDKPNGRTVLLLHGKNFNAAYWERTANDLSGQGYRVIMPDQIGFGKSSKPVAFQFSFDALATFTNSLLDSIGVDQVEVVGHSMGGMVAARFALMFPGRTDKLVLVNPIGLEDWQHTVPYTPIEKTYDQELAKTPQGVKDYMRESYFDGNWEPEYDDVARLQMEWTRSPDRERLAWVSALTYDMIFTQPVIHDFDQIAVPTLLIIGTRDRTALGKGLVTPEVRATMGRYDRLGRHARDLIPGSKLVEIEGVGHMPQIEAYDRYIAALVGFLGD